MNLSIETLFTTALGLQAPWTVKDIELNTAKRRIDFQVVYEAKRMACPICGMADQGIHDRAARSWRHLDFFQYEAWLHAEVPRVQCGGCGKTTQVSVPWAREGSGFTLLFEALALSLCRELPVSQAASLMRVAAKRLWTRIAHYVPLARAQDDMSGVRRIGVDETSAKKGHEYITVVHDLDAKRLLFACAGRDHEILKTFTDDLRARGRPEAVEHVCMDMSAAYTKGATQACRRPASAMTASTSLPWRTRRWTRCAAKRCAPRRRRCGRRWEPTDKEGRQAPVLGDAQEPGELEPQADRHHALAATLEPEERAGLAAEAGVARGIRPARWRAMTRPRPTGIEAWLSWARRCRLEPFKRLAQTLAERFDGVVRGMLDGRSNAFVEAMNGLLQQTKTAARGFRTTENFIAIAYLRMSKLKHLPDNPLVPAVPRSLGCYVHRI
jgi:transposase